MPTLRIKSFWLQYEKATFFSQSLEEKVKPGFTHLTPIFAGCLCFQFFCTITALRNANASLFLFEKVSIPSFTGIRSILVHEYLRGM